MKEWYGTTTIINDKVYPIEPFPLWAQDFFESYSLVLKEIYGNQENDLLKKDA